MIRQFLELFLSPTRRRMRHIEGSVVDPQHFDADPDAACYFDPDPDPTFNFVANPSFQIQTQNLKKCSNRLVLNTFGLSSANWCRCWSYLSIWYGSMRIHADPDPQHWWQCKVSSSLFICLTPPFPPIVWPSWGGQVISYNLNMVSYWALKVLQYMTSNTTPPSPPHS